MSKPVIGIGSDVHASPGKREQAFAYMTYVEALGRAGAVAVLIPPQAGSAEEIIRRLDGLLLAGGKDCDPALYGEERHHTVELMAASRQSNDLALAEAARRHGLPTLGICLGLQVMNVAAGGLLVQDIASQVQTGIQHASQPEHRARHDVIVEEGTRLRSILGEREINVNSSHHQAVKELGRGLRATASAPDGIVEGVEDPDHLFYLGVQWHPEDMRGERSASRLFAAFADAARRYAAGRQQEATDLSPAAAALSE